MWGVNILFLVVLKDYVVDYAIHGVDVLHNSRLDEKCVDDRSLVVEVVQ